MLENKIIELSKKIVLAAAGIALNLSCAPSLTVPVEALNQYGQLVSTGIDCCKEHDCKSKGYDYCKLEDKKYNPQTGGYERDCSCYDLISRDPFDSMDKNRGPGGPKAKEAGL
ncbi:hypothetical protein HZC30_08285 [Candidatus Woesearchaeota archaeon]|nr:hypothetical protein [Candidatus Woesearchaeota archaeon]